MKKVFSDLVNGVKRIGDEEEKIETSMKIEQRVNCFTTQK